MLEFYLPAMFWNESPDGGFHTSTGLNLSLALN
jgi:hypothetical protein